MKKIIIFLKNFFDFSYRERSAFLILTPLLLIGLLVVPGINFLFRIEVIKPEFSRLELRISDSTLQAWNEPKIDGHFQTKENKYERNSYREDTPNERFPFDPNTASSQDLQSLGVPRFLADRIIKYRSKGGKFFKKEDLMRIYDFPKPLYDDLKPYISISSARKKDQRGSFTDSGDKPKDKPTYENAYKKDDEPFRKKDYQEDYRKTKIQPFDLNTCDTAQLKQIRGIGAGYSSRIIKYRKLIGGFTSHDQLNEVYGLPPKVIKKLEELTFIEEDFEPQKININKASAFDLSKLPYLSKTEARMIVNYRKQHGKFKSMEALYGIYGLPTEKIKKLEEYFTVE